MDGKIFLIESEDGFNYQFIESNKPFGYEISINTDLSKDFISLMEDTDDLEESIDLQIEISELPELAEFYKKAKKEYKRLLKAAEYVSFSFSIEEVSDYVKRNPILKSKKIILAEVTELDSDIVSKVKSLFGENSSNIYFIIVGNERPISLKDYESTLNFIDKKVEEIKRFNFSPLETIMYAYDMVRDRIYTAEEENEDETVSRDLSSVLFGDKIVCVGYARIFKAILEKSGIDCRMFYLDDSTISDMGHARNEIYVQDEKYGVDGVYYFDPTWDSKKWDDDDIYLLSYKHFAMTRKVMDCIDNGRLNSHFYYSDYLAEEFKETVDKEGYTSLSSDMLRGINHMSSIINHKTLINRAWVQFGVQSLLPDKDEVYEELGSLMEYFDKPLSANTLLEVLYNVRKVQYYQNPLKFPFGLNEFYNAVLLSGWEFEGTVEENFMFMFYNSKQRQKVQARQITKYSNDTDLDKKIGQVKLTKVLRHMLNNKTSQK